MPKALKPKACKGWAISRNNKMFSYGNSAIHAWWSLPVNKMCGAEDIQILKNKGYRCIRVLITPV